MQRFAHHFAAGVACLVLVSAIAGCRKNEDFNNDALAGMDEPDANAGTFETTTRTELPEIPSSSLRFVDDNTLETIYFDYNSYSLRADALSALTRNAEVMRSNPGVIYQIEGHCDERGTQEYNLALGEKRALATREHLMRLGVSGDRVITISYGEEDPVDPGHIEASWARNRRCEFNRAM